MLKVELNENAEQGEITLKLSDALWGLGDALRRGRQIAFDIQFPPRFTGELQAFVRDRRGRSQYGSMELVENHEDRRSATAKLVPSRRMPAMGYQDRGFDPGVGIQELGLKISAQSDRVRGSGYRPFRGTITVARVRVRDADPKSDPPPEIRGPEPQPPERSPKSTPAQFVAASGFDRPWPLGYGFSGPLDQDHLEQLERTCAAIARHGCSFTRVYLGDYRSGLLLDAHGNVAGVEPAFLDYVDRLAEIAGNHGITVMFSLTDNTMADGRGLENVELLVDPVQSEHFVRNALARFVKRLQGREVIWDVFNEPENVTAVPLRSIQRYVERVLAAGRSADPQARFTVVSRSRPEIVYWQGRGLDLYSHNLFTDRALAESLQERPMLDAPIMVAEMAPELVTSGNLEALRAAGYLGIGIWGWDTQDKFAWRGAELRRLATPLIEMK